MKWSPVFSVLRLRALPGFRALMAGDRAWSVLKSMLEKPLFRLFSGQTNIKLNKIKFFQTWLYRPKDMGQIVLMNPDIWAVYLIQMDHKYVWYSPLVWAELCQATSQTVDTMDNVTYSYNPPSCWTLMSGHCADKPSYAVFIRKASGGGGNSQMDMKASLFCAKFQTKV